MKLHRDWRHLVRAAKEQGWTIVERNGKVKLIAPNGESTWIHGTPSERRGLYNKEADLRKMGLAL